MQLPAVPGALALALLAFPVAFAAPRRSRPAVFVVFAFTSAVDLVISLEEDGYVSGFVELYVREGEPYLRTAHGIMICYWDGVVHHGLYLAMIAAMSRR
uniref:Transmembrane 6 superfamily member 1/2 transmembrane domain-containing protein n=1 Tax=Dromaius novaehollandiae TaxID=8790 RepID=A0A8C4IYK6_DRONO